MKEQTTINYEIETKTDNKDRYRGYLQAMKNRSEKKENKKED